MYYFAQFCRRSWCLGTASLMPMSPCCPASVTRCTRQSRICPTTSNTQNRLPSSQLTAYRLAPTHPPTATRARPTAAQRAAPPSHTPRAALSPAAPSRCQVRLITRSFLLFNPEHCWVFSFFFPLFFSFNSSFNCSHVYIHALFLTPFCFYRNRYYLCF